MKWHTSALLAAIAAVLLMACVPVLIKLVSATEIEIGIVRLAIASIGVSGFLYWRGFRWQLTRSQWRALLLLGLIFAVHWYLYFKSIKLSTPAIGSIGVSTYGIQLIVLSALFLRQKITLIDAIALGFVAIGVYLVSPEFSWQSDYTLGLWIGILSGFFYACLPIVHIKMRDIPNGTRAWGQFTFALLFFAPFGFHQSWQLADIDWYYLIFLGAVSTMVAHSLWVKASTELASEVTSVVYYLYVPAAMLLSFLLANETITGAMIAGALIIIMANAMTLLKNVRWLRRGR